MQLPFITQHRHTDYQLGGVAQSVRALPLDAVPLIAFQANLSVCISDYWFCASHGKGSWFKPRPLHFLLLFGVTAVCGQIGLAFFGLFGGRNRAG